MSAYLEVLAAGAYASIQDRGRRGFRRIGVPWAGVLDLRLMRIANALVGNAEAAPVIEAFDGGLRLAAREGPVRLAVAGDAELERESGSERRPLPVWRSVTLADGDTLQIRRVTHGRLAVVAVAGLALPTVMGSASTYARAALGGVDGRPLAAGTRMPAAPPPAAPERRLPRPPARDAAPIRAVPGPQADHFAADALARFFASQYRVSPAADRMGIRLDGPAIAHARACEIVSDATVPGSIQVPGNGRPIVLLADAQTAGGYPKIATVIGADLGRLADLRPGDALRFAPVGAADAERAARAADADTRALLATIRALAADGIDTDALYAANLVGGVVDALSPEYRPVAGPANGLSEDEER